MGFFGVSDEEHRAFVNNIVGHMTKMKEEYTNDIKVLADTLRSHEKQISDILKREEKFSEIDEIHKELLLLREDDETHRAKIERIIKFVERLSERMENLKDNDDEEVPKKKSVESETADDVEDLKEELTEMEQDTKKAPISYCSSCKKDRKMYAYKKKKVRQKEMIIGKCVNCDTTIAKRVEEEE